MNKSIDSTFDFDHGYTVDNRRYFSDLDLKNVDVMSDYQEYLRNGEYTEAAKCINNADAFNFGAWYFNMLVNRLKASTYYLQNVMEERPEWTRYQSTEPLDVELNTSWITGYNIDTILHLYSITVEDSENGTIIANPVRAISGDMIYVYFNGDENYVWDREIYFETVSPFVQEVDISNVVIGGDPDDDTVPSPQEGNISAITLNGSSYQLEIPSVNTKAPFYDVDGLTAYNHNLYTTLGYGKINDDGTLDTSVEDFQYGPMSWVISGSEYIFSGDLSSYALMAEYDKNKSFLKITKIEKSPFVVTLGSSTVYVRLCTPIIKSSTPTNPRWRFEYGNTLYTKSTEQYYWVSEHNQLSLPYSLKGIGSYYDVLKISDTEQTITENIEEKTVGDIQWLVEIGTCVVYSSVNALVSLSSNDFYVMSDTYTSFSDSPTDPAIMMDSTMDQIIGRDSSGHILIKDTRFGTLNPEKFMTDMADTKIRYVKDPTIKTLTDEEKSTILALQTYTNKTSIWINAGDLVRGSGTVGYPFGSTALCPQTPLELDEYNRFEMKNFPIKLSGSFKQVSSNELKIYEQITYPTGLNENNQVYIDMNINKVVDGATYSDTKPTEATVGTVWIGGDDE